MSCFTSLNGYEVKDAKAREDVLHKLFYFDDIETAKESNITEGEMFVLNGYDTIFKVTSSTTISSLELNDGLYADVISKSAIIDSLGITSTIDVNLFAEIVEYVRNKGIELVFGHKTYTLNSTINLTSANKLKLSGLGYNSVIDYTGNDYAFIINSFQQSIFYNFTINCVNNGGGIYFKYPSGSSQSNLVTCSKLERIYIYNSKNPVKLDCHFGYFDIINCIFQVGTIDGIAIDFRNCYYPEFFTIERTSLRTIYNETINTGIGIAFSSGNMINILNNDILGFNIGIQLDHSGNSESCRTINIENNALWDCLTKAIYIVGNSSARPKNIGIHNCEITSSKRVSSLEYGIQIASVQGLDVQNISVTQPVTHIIWCSDSPSGKVSNIQANSSNITQTNNQIGQTLNYDYIQPYKILTLEANSSQTVTLGSALNIVNFHNYNVFGRNLVDLTGVSISNQSISNGIITFTLTNSTANDISLNVVAF